MNYLPNQRPPTRPTIDLPWLFTLLILLFLLGVGIYTFTLPR